MHECSEGDYRRLNEGDRSVFEEYRGKWIAVYRGEIIAVADRAYEAMRQADERCPSGDYALEGVDWDTDTIYWAA